MIHPGFGPNHPTNQDDRLKNESFFVFFSEMFGFSSQCHPGLKMAISAQHGPIILPSSWVVRLTSSVRAIILLSSYRQWVIAVVGTSFFFSFASSWRHPGDLLFLDWGSCHPSTISILQRQRQRERVDMRGVCKHSRLRFVYLSWHHPATRRGHPSHQRVILVSSCQASTPRHHPGIILHAGVAISYFFGNYCFLVFRSLIILGPRMIILIFTSKPVYNI